MSILDTYYQDHSQNTLNLTVTFMVIILVLVVNFMSSLLKVTKVKNHYCTKEVFLWDNLPDHIKIIELFEKFAKGGKEYLFNKYFS